MTNLNEGRDLLIAGANLELCGELECANIVYKLYIKEAALTDDKTDALEMLYGQHIYDTTITSYGEAIAWATVALACKKILQLIRSRFAYSYCWSSNGSDRKIADFFEWLGSSRNEIDFNRDMEILKGAFRTLSSSDSIAMQLASGSSLSPLEVVQGLISGQLTVIGGKIQS